MAKVTTSTNEIEENFSINRMMTHHPLLIIHSSINRKVKEAFREEMDYREENKL